MSKFVRFLHAHQFLVMMCSIFCICLSICLLAMERIESIENQETLEIIVITPEPTTEVKEPEPEPVEPTEEPEPEIIYYVGEGLMEDGSPVMVPEEPSEYLSPNDYWTKEMKEAHIAANERRAQGYGENDEIIAACRSIWTSEKESLDIMAKMIANECGFCPWQQLLDTGSCLKHRVERPNWPNTVYECITQPGQYLSTYANGKYADTPARCYAAAVYVLDGVYQIPNNVVYQANFSQGAGVWRKAYVNIGNFTSVTYFCYDIDWSKR